MKIQFQVIPDKCIGRNLHSHDIISPEKWQKISINVRKKSGTCKYCERKYDMNELNAHEVWEFDTEQGIQRLIDIIPVCGKCHMTAHYQNLLKNNNLSEREAFICRANYMEVNHCTEKECENALDEALKNFRMLNQIEVDWKLDISYAFKMELIEYGNVDLENLEALAPGSVELLLPYRKVYRQLSFNMIPHECLIDFADKAHRSMRIEKCKICGKEGTVFYQFHDLRIKDDTLQMIYTGRRNICKLCRDTIYFGMDEGFSNYQKTAEHYMSVNNCSYEEFLEDAERARNSCKYSKNDLYICLRVPYVYSHEAYKYRLNYLLSNGVRKNVVTNAWYLYPVRNLKRFISLL